MENFVCRLFRQFKALTKIENGACFLSYKSRKTTFQSKIEKHSKASLRIRLRNHFQKGSNLVRQVIKKQLWAMKKIANCRFKVVQNHSLINYKGSQ